MSAFVQLSFASAQRTVRRLTSVQRICAIVVSVFDRAAVVRREYDQRVLRQVQSVERRKHLTHGPVELVNYIATPSAVARAPESRMRHHRLVNVVRG